MSHDPIDDFLRKTIQRSRILRALFPDVRVRRTCPAALNIKGEHFDCDWPTNEDGRHPGWAHSSGAAEAIWIDDRTTSPAVAE